MGLLQDIEKARKIVNQHRVNCGNDDAYLNAARRMKECEKMSMLMTNFLDSLAKDVKKADQKELTKEQAKLFKQVVGDMASVSVLTQWMMCRDAGADFIKHHDAMTDALKKLE